MVLGKVQKNREQGSKACLRQFRVDEAFVGWYVLVDFDGGHRRVKGNDSISMWLSQKILNMT